MFRYVLNHFNLTMSEREFKQLCTKAASYIASADVLVVCTGAGFSADSGLKIYNDIAGHRANEEYMQVTHM